MKILLADDHGLYRDSMCAWLKALGDEVEIDTAADYAGVQDKLGNDKDYALILLDLCMPGMNGTESIRAICEQTQGVPLIVVSADEHPLAIQGCLQAGADGFVPKSSDGEAILAAIRLVLAGGTYIPQSAQSVSMPAFSAKQLQILKLLVDGCSNKEIAERLYLTEGTVKQYVSDILRKLDVDNRTQAGIKAREILGLGPS